MHVFLTGNIQVGKTTAIQRYINKYGYKVKGFRTLSGPFAEDGSSEIYMVAADNPEDLREENIVIWRHGYYAQKGVTVNLDVYENYGVELLENTEGCDIIMMDELGPKELNAKEFVKRAKACIDGDVPVMGVLMKKGSPLFYWVKNHPKVTVLEVTEENRDRVFQELPPVERWGEPGAFDKCR
ncbi:MAG: hypothetical protein IKV96_01870 [Firmicutes bacterium]|nr:hypothetical protein [Bacillota bacterium]